MCATAAPFVRLSGKAYVLPTTGQQGIPLVTVNTDTVKVSIYRIGDRNLLDTVLGGNFERNLYTYDLEDIAESKGEKLWTGELAVKKELNAEITTAFPVTEAVPTLAPGVYVLAAEPAQQASNDYGQRATQWFVVSDLGLAAYSGGDGIHAFINSLATTAPVDGVELRLIARNNEVLAVKKSGADGTVTFEPGLARGEGGLSPAMLDRRRPERRLCVSQSQAIAVRSDRSRRERPRHSGRTRRLSCSRSVASIAPARRCMSRRCCATPKAMLRPTRR